MLRDLAIEALSTLASLVTPELREYLEDVVWEFKERADKTENKWDDVLAIVLVESFDIQPQETSEEDLELGKEAKKKGFGPLPESEQETGPEES